MIRKFCIVLYERSVMIYEDYSIRKKFRNNKVYFLTLVISKTRNNTDNYVFRSKRLDYLMFQELEKFLEDETYMLVKIES